MYNQIEHIYYIETIIKETTAPIGPGKGQVKPLVEALQSIIQKIRGHIHGLRDSGEAEAAKIFGLYETAMELI